jgi:hypothetical protein
MDICHYFYGMALKDFEMVASSVRVSRAGAVALVQSENCAKSVNSEDSCDQLCLCILRDTSRILNQSSIPAFVDLWEDISAPCNYLLKLTKISQNAMRGSRS